MQYMVRGADGNEYGPVDADTLRQWVQENRLRPESDLRDVQTGESMKASAIPGLFAQPVAAPPSQWSQPPAPTAQAQVVSHDGGKGALWGSIIRSVLAVVCFFFLHTLGVIFAGYALFYAFQAKAHGNRYGNLAIGIAAVAMLAVLVGWYLRFQGVLQ